MQAGEIRTLTYNVMLDSNYTRLIQGKNGSIFANEAVLSSKGIERKTVVSNFNENSELLPNKEAIDYVANSDGVGGTITYVVKLVAPSTNTIPLKDVKFKDVISGDVSIVNGSVYLYNGNAITGSNYNSSYNTAANSENQIAVSIGTTSDGKYYFSCNVGDFEANTTKWLYYKVTVNDSMYLNTQGGENAISIDNTASVYSRTDDINTDPCSASSTTNKKISFAEWSHKYNATKVTEDKTINMEGDVYDSSKNPTTGTTSFEVKSGYYEYNVVVNKAGILNIDNAELLDNLGSNMKYIGYLRVDTYCSNSVHGDLDDEITKCIYPSDSDNPYRTVWMNIQDLTSFRFKPSELGISETCSIVLTYYVRPTFTDDLFMTIDNEFNITGEIGSGTNKHYLYPKSVSVSATIQVDSSCNVTKDFWYYVRAGATDDPEKPPSGWNNGAMYWLLKVSGTNIPANTAFRDTIVTSYNGNSYKGQEMDSDYSFIGVYVVPTDNNYYSLSDLNEAVENNKATEISSSDYDLAWSEDKKSVDVTFKNDIDIAENTEVYIVIKTKLLEYKTRGGYSYANSVYQKLSDSNNFLLTAKPTVYNSRSDKYISKDLTTVFD
jgi:hypothetical protein